jgi:DNA polymerase
MRNDKSARLAAIADSIEKLEESPLYAFRAKSGYRPVVGEGEPDARIMFIGEAPGEQEAKSGRPFVGSAGRVLNKLLESIGLDRKATYITSVIKDRPPGNRDPTTAEIRLYAPFLMQQIEIIQPSVIVTLGRFAKDLVLEQFNVPERAQGMSELHGRALPATAPYGTVTIVPMYHPAAAFYNRELETTLQEDFRTLQQVMT